MIGARRPAVVPGGPCMSAPAEFTVWAPVPERVRIQVDGAVPDMTRGDGGWGGGGGARGARRLVAGGGGGGPGGRLRLPARRQRPPPAGPAEPPPARGRARPLPPLS